jgi:hypothetical protein
MLYQGFRAFWRIVENLKEIWFSPLQLEEFVDKIW